MIDAVPQWVIVHVPHDSRRVPPGIRDQFVLDDAHLEAELVAMTDHHVADIFSNLVPPDRTLRADVSRLIVDVERFLDDEHEPMAARGMGAIYTRTAHGAALRRSTTAGERTHLIDTYYRPHHFLLEAAVQHALTLNGRCLILDCHSFPGIPLPYESVQEVPRPDICLGTDAFHTPEHLREAFVAAFRVAGFTVAIDTPFAGALVPMTHWRSEPHVHSAMIEINRGLYLEEGTAIRGPRFDAVKRSIVDACVRAVTA